jgi:uncharacterized protein
MIFKKRAMGIPITLNERRPTIALLMRKGSALHRFSLVTRPRLWDETFMHFLRRSFALLCLLLPLSAKIHAADGPPVKPRHFLWSVADDKGDGRVYLLGSLHLCRPDMYPLPELMDAAYRDSKAVALEVKLDERTQTEIASKFVKYGLNEHGVGLTGQLAKETQRALDAYCASNKVARETFERMRPWFAGITITLMELQKAGLDPDLGLDKHFADRAAKDLKPVFGLETPDDQLGLLGNLDAKTQDLMLRQAVMDARDLAADIDLSIAAWKSGDTAKLDAILLKDFRTPEFLELWDKLIVERNQHFAAHVRKFLDDDAHVLVVVGSGHLVGPESVPALLEKAGLKVRQH